MGTIFNNGIDHRNTNNYFTSVGSADNYKNFLWKFLDSGAIVAASRPAWALYSEPEWGGGTITDDITVLITHENTYDYKYWHYFDLVRVAGGRLNHEYHIIRNE